MSMMKTLAKVAIGVAVAKGVSGMMKKGSSRPAPANPGQGGLFGGAYSPGAQQGSASGGGLEDLLGGLLGGRPASGGGAAQSGGLGGLLEQLAGGGATSGQPQGGLNDLMRGVVKKPQAAPSFGEDEVADTPQRGFGDLLNQSIASQDEPEVRPSADQEALAALMLRAMIMAMKSDGEIDAAEQARLMDRLGDISPDEQAFVQAELRSPLDAGAIAREVPRGLESQVYAMSVMGIDLDNQREAQYLHDLAGSMGIAPEGVNQIHDHLGVPRIYA